jgi:hypothetical protein
MAGLASIVSELRIERTNLINELRHVNAVLAVLANGTAAVPAQIKAYALSLRSRRDQSRARAAMGKENCE